MRRSVPAVSFPENRPGNGFGPIDAQLPLACVRIIDCTHAMAGPYATSLMGDLGADVIKVEPPKGDFIRAMDENLGPGESTYFYSINRSKRSIVIDLKHSEAHSVLNPLLARADVFITNLRASAVRHLGIDYESIRRVRPEIVYCSVTAFGEGGPRASQPGLDLVGQAVSGIMAMTGERGGPPIKAGPSLTDILTAYLLCFSVTAALRARDRDGEGQKIELNLADSGLSSMPNLVTEYLQTGAPIQPEGSGHPQAVPYQAFLASDAYFVLACLSDRFWAIVCDAIDHPELLADARYRTNPDRVSRRTELVATLAAIFATQPRSHWLARFERAGVPCGPVNRLEDVVNDPQFVHNSMLLTLRHPQIGDYTVINNPIRFSRTPARPRGYAPMLGEHTVEVLSEAGLPDDVIRSLLNNHVVVDAGSAIHESAAPRANAPTPRG
jgi:crotonobetainyl-CoA:carnitine CoA-transferase CaiB-like acyl-CoA transferase